MVSQSVRSRQAARDRTRAGAAASSGAGAVTPNPHHRSRAQRLGLLLAGLVAAAAVHQVAAKMLDMNDRDSDGVPNGCVGAG